MQKTRNIPELIFKGMNNKEKPEFLKEGYCQLLQDCVVENEQIQEGPGAITLFNIGTNKKILGGIATASEVYVAVNEPGDTLAFIYRFTGSGQPVVVSSANLAANTEVNFVDTGTAVYVFNGTTATGKLVGSTYTQPAGLPIAPYGAWHNNRLYALTAANRLYYSDANTPDTFGGSSYIDIFPSFRSIGTGLSSINGVLVVGKRDNIITFDGYTTDDFTVKRLTEELPNFGVTSHRSMVNTGDDLYFMSFAGDVPHIRSLKRTSFNRLNYGGTISDPIEGTMRNLNKSRLEQVCGGFDGRYCYWGVPYGTSIVNNYMIMYDTVKEAWSVHPSHSPAVLFRSTISGDDRMYYGDASSTSKLYGISFNVTAIDTTPLQFKVKSRRYRPQVSNKSKFKYVQIKTGEDADVSIAVSGSPDGYTEELQGTISQQVSGSVFPMTFPFAFGTTSDKPHTVHLASTPSYTYELTFEKDTTNETMSGVFPFTFPISFGGDSTQVIIKEWDLMYYPRGFRSQNG